MVNYLGDVRSRVQVAMMALEAKRYNDAIRFLRQAERYLDVMIDEETEWEDERNKYLSDVFE